MTEDGLTHIDADGRARMVDVGGKKSTRRRAVVQSLVRLNPDTFALLEHQALPKGDVLTTAQIAGIQAAKKTADLIPMCHPLFLSHVDVRFRLDPKNHLIVVEAEAVTTAPTGVEMEALVAAQVASMTIYDMCKAVQRDIVISDCRLIHKSGGRSGEYNA
ncbi:MAG: cyclic pyranopterin monophosphate synthase MoaC [Deltaproteobacteria bacterium]|nr:cyclic pyranopterin monophosphate synthase MoaC [Deltaproteobacteria bacterium]